MTPSTYFTRTLLLGSLLLVSFQSACKKADAPVVVPTVTVSAPLEQEVTDWDDYSGRLESPKAVTVAAQVSGVIQKASFEEGSLVKEGDALFVIDERPFQAELNNKKAESLKAQSEVTLAELKFKRYDKIRETKAISDQEYDQALAALQQARAQLLAAKADEDKAALNLEWATVRAPVSGRVSKKFVTEGNLVNGNSAQANQLTTIMSVDPLFAYINAPESAFLNYQSLVDKRKAEANYHLPTEVQLENETNYPHKGFVDFIDNKVDPSTGTIQIRTQVSNADGALTPGLFARMRIMASDPYSAITVPDNAIGTDQNSRYVLVLGNENTVEYRAVKLGRLFGDKRVIRDGLKTSDKVIVKGIQSARPGTKVNPVTEPASEGASQGGAK